MHKNPYGSHGCHATSFYATSETLFKSDYLKRRVKKETLFEPIRNELSPFFYFIYC